MVMKDVINKLLKLLLTNVEPQLYCNKIFPFKSSINSQLVLNEKDDVNPSW